MMENHKGKKIKINAAELEILPFLFHDYIMGDCSFASSCKQRWRMVDRGATTFWTHTQEIFFALLSN